MEKKIATYLLGVAMGIIIMAFLNVLIFDTNTNEKVLLDVKGLYSVSDLKKSGMNYWRL